MFRRKHSCFRPIWRHHILVNLSFFKFIFRNQLKYIIISFSFLQLISLRLPREVISFGQLSRGSDVYTLAMLFYQVYMAFSVHNDLQTVPFSRKHRSCVNRRLFSDQSFFIRNQSFYYTGISIYKIIININKVLFLSLGFERRVHFSCT